MCIIEEMCVNNPTDKCADARKELETGNLNKWGTCEHFVKVIFGWFFRMDINVMEDNNEQGREFYDNISKSLRKTPIVKKLDFEEIKKSGALHLTFCSFHNKIMEEHVLPDFRKDMNL